MRDNLAFIAMIAWLGLAFVSLLIHASSDFSYLCIIVASIWNATSWLRNQIVRHANN